MRLVLREVTPTGHDTSSLRQHHIHIGSIRASSSPLPHYSNTDVLTRQDCETVILNTMSCVAGLSAVTLPVYAFGITPPVPNLCRVRFI